MVHCVYDGIEHTQHAVLDCERWNFIIHHVNPVNSCNNSNSVSDGT